MIEPVAHPPAAEPFSVTAVVPLKPLGAAKSRLTLPEEARRGLAWAFAHDTLAALVGCDLVSGVLVVTSDPALVERLQELPVRPVPDGGLGLGAAVRDGLRVAARWQPGSGVVVVPADLPCLRPDDVTRVLTAAAPAPRGAFVPDWSGTGTTLVVHGPGGSGATDYGPDSAERHRSLGLRPLLDAPQRARHDVDTLDDLAAAVALGVGRETASALAALDGLGAALAT